jgi:uncharacterized protein (TIGR00251 family)
VARARPKVQLTEEAVDRALREVDGLSRLVVNAKPKSAKEGLEVGSDGGVVVRVNAPPVDGKANARILHVIAAAIGVSVSEVSIARGETARAKELVIARPLEDVRTRLLSAG